MTKLLILSIVAASALISARASAACDVTGVVDDGVADGLHYFTYYGDFSCGYSSSYPTVLSFGCTNETLNKGALFTIVQGEYSYSGTYQINMAVSEAQMETIGSGMLYCEATISSHNNILYGQDYTEQ